MKRNGYKILVKEGVTLFYVWSSPEYSYNTFDLFPIICGTLGKNNHGLQNYGLYDRS